MVSAISVAVARGSEVLCITFSDVFSENNVAILFSPFFVFSRFLAVSASVAAESQIDQRTKGMIAANDLSLDAMREKKKR